MRPRLRLVCFCILLSGSIALVSAGGRDAPLARVKPADAEIRRLIAVGYEHSQTFRALVDEIDRSNLIVVVQFGECGNGRIRSCVAHVESLANTRHVRIKVGAVTMDSRRIATIAHELQHAVEIARAPQATDAKTVLALYRKISIGGCRSGVSDRCETVAALKVEERVNDELARSNSPD